MSQTIPFIIIVLVLLALSMRSLRVPEQHGFPRFFAWVCIAFLFVRNREYWHTDMLSLHQMISSVLLTVSIVIVALGAYWLRTRGKPSSEREGGAMFDFERTSVLVTTGVYRFVRHPLYASLIYLTWGIFFK